MSNIHDVAKLANVSAMTVSRVLNQSGYVKEETRQRVLKAMEKANYIPNVLARSLSTQKTSTVALIVPDITNPFFTTVSRGTEDMLRKSGYRLILCNSDDDLVKEQDYIDMCLAMRVEGVVIAPTGEHSKKNLQKLIKYSVPFVCIDREVKGISCDLIKGDNTTGARQLVQHLIDLGHQHIAMIAGPTSTSTSRDRIEGYKQALELNGLPFCSEYVKVTPYHNEFNNETVSELLQLSPQPTAIFAVNNFVGSRVYQALQAEGIRIPEDISLVGFDAIDPYLIGTSFLTSAIQPAYNFGSLSVQLLLERIHDAPVNEPRKMILSPEIVTRVSSTKPPK